MRIARTVAHPVRWSSRSLATAASASAAPAAAAAAARPAAPGLPDTLVAKDIINKNKMSYLRDQLTADNRFRMHMSEFEALLVANDVDLADGKEFLKGLHTAGIVLYYPQRAPDWVYLKPRAITRELLHMLDPDGTVTSALMRNKAADLAKLEQDFADMTKTKRALDEVAMSRGQRWTYGVVAAVTAQGALMARLIWWDLSWDVMEPIAYLLSFTYLTFGWAYFVIARDDIAEYGTIAGRYVHGVKNKLYAKAGFSQEAYDALSERILTQKKTLKAYGVVTPAERKEYPIPHGVLRDNLLHPHAHAAAPPTPVTSNKT